MAYRPTHRSDVLLSYRSATPDDEQLAQFASKMLAAAVSVGEGDSRKTVEKASGKRADNSPRADA